MTLSKALVPTDEQGTHSTQLVWKLRHMLYAAERRDAYGL